MVNNTASVATADSNTAKEAGGIANGSLGYGASGNVLSNDTGAAPLQVSAVRANNGNTAVVGQRLTGSSGYLTLHADGSYTYEVRETQRDAMDTGDVAVDRFTYTVTDVNGATSSAVLTISVLGTNDAAVAANINGTVTEDGVYSGQTSATDVDDNVFTYALVGSAPAGLVFNSNGSFTLTPTAADQALDTGESRVVSFQYVANDGEIDSAPATVKIIITGTNDAPVATIITASTSEDTAYHGQVSATDIDDTAFTYAVVGTAPAGLLFNTDGSFIFTPTTAHQALRAGESAIVSFQYVANDGEVNSAPATVTLTVTGANDAPVAVGLNASTTEDAVYNGNVTATDVDSSNLSYALVGSAPAGVVFNANGSFSVTPTAADQALNVGASRIVSFQYTANDGELNSASATVSITITGTNDGPVAHADSNTAKEAGGIANSSFGYGASGNVLSNDTDIDAGHVLTVTGVRSSNGNVATAGARLTGSSGYLTLNGDGSYTYTVRETQRDAMDTGDVATDRFTYTVRDEHGATSTAVLTITVLGTNDAAVAANITASITEESSGYTGQATATDVDDNAFTFHLVGSAPDGVTFNSNGSFTVVPTAADQGLAVGATRIVSFQYVANDGEIDSAPATVKVTITGTNDAPVAGNMTVSVSEDAGISSTALAGSDIDGDSLSYSLVGSAPTGVSIAAGQLVVNTASYQSLTEGQSEVLSVQYQVSDGLASATATATITIVGANDIATFGGSHAGTVTEAGIDFDDQPIVGSFTTSGTLTVSDADTGQSSARAQTNSAGTYGSFSIDSSGHWNYTLNSESAAVNALAEGYAATDSFTVYSFDGLASQAVVITIQGSNDDPYLVGTAAPGSVTEDTGATLTSSGHFKFDDPETGNIHGILGVTPASGNSLGGSLKATLTTAATGAGVGQVDWTYKLNNNAAQSLGAGQSVVESFTVTVSDGLGGQLDQTVSVVVHGVNDGASLSGTFDANISENGGSITNYIGVSDADAGESKLQVQSDVARTFGSFNVLADGQWTYTVDGQNSTVDGLTAGQTLTDSIVVTSLDGSASRTVTVHIQGVNDAPKAVDDSISATEGGASVTGSLATNDRDPEGYSLSYSIDTCDAPAGLTVNSNGSYSFDPTGSAYDHLAQGASEQISVQVTVSDGNSTSTSTLNIVVHGSNDAPVAQDDSACATEGGSSVTGSVACNDSDIDDGASLSYSLVAPVAGLTLNADGSYSFDPTDSAYDHIASGSSATVTASYIVTDEHGASDTAVLIINVSGTNDDAVIGGDTTGGVTEAGGLDNATVGTSSVSGTLTVSDVDDGEESFRDSCGTQVTASGRGSYSIDTEGNWTYTLNDANADVQALRHNQTLNDTFTVASYDGTTQVVTVTITGRNDAPYVICADDTASAQEDCGVNLDGQLTGSGSIRFDDYEALNFHAVSVEAGSGNTFSGVLTAELITAAQGSGEGLIDWNFAIDNADVQGLAEGESVVESYSVLITDSAGAVREQVIEITLTGSNDGVDITGGSFSGSLDEDDSDSIGGSIAFSDADLIDSHSASASCAAYGTAGASVTDDSDSSADGSVGWTYAVDNGNSTVQALAAGESLADSFTVTVSDGNGQSDTQVIEIVIHGTNDQVVVTGSVGDSSVTEDGCSIGGSVGFSDVDLSDTHSSSADGAVYGTVSVDVSSDSTNGASGIVSWTYDLDDSLVQDLGVGQSVADSFVITIDDGNGGEASEVVSVVIHGSNDGVVITAETVSGSLGEDDSASVGGSISFSDVDNGDTHSASINTASYGTAGYLLDGDNVSWTYTVNNAETQYLAAGESVADSFVITVSDGHGGDATQVVDIVINGSNDGPELAASSDTVSLNDGSKKQFFTRDFSDVDLSDTHTVSASGASKGNVSVSIKEGDEATGDGSGSVTVTYTVSSSIANTLSVGESIADSFTLTVTDNHGATSTQTIDVVIQGLNDDPTVTSYSGDSNNIVTEDQGINGSGQLTDTGTVGFDDADRLDTHTVTVESSRDNALGGSLTATIATSATGDAIGQVNYSYAVNNSAAQHLAADQVATEVFSIIIADNHGGSAVQTVVMSVQGRNDAPVGVNDSASISEDAASITVTAVEGVLANDTDVDDGHELSVTAVKTGGVEGAGTAGLINVALAGQYGSLTMAADGSYRYVLNNSATIQGLGDGESLVDSFNYLVSDGHAGGTDTAVLNIVIQGSNDAPVISGLTGSGQYIGEDSTATLSGSFQVTDADSTLTIGGGSASGASHGTASASFSGLSDGSASFTWRYNLDETSTSVQALGSGETLTDSFTVSYNDGEGAISSQVVSVVINGSNDNPVVTAGGTVTGSVGEDEAGTISGTFTVTDVDSVLGASGSQATVSSGGDTHGTASATLDANGLVTWTYDVNQHSSAVQALGANETLTDSFTVTISDGDDGSVTQVVSVTIQGSNDAPTVVISGGTFNGSVDEDETTTFSGTFGVTDVDSDLGASGSEAFVAGAGSAYGTATASLDTNGVVTWTYDLDQGSSQVQALRVNESLADSFTITVTDGDGASTTKVIEIVIDGVNDAPVVSAGAVVTGSIGEDSSDTVDGSFAVTDVDGDGSTFGTSFTSPSHGSFSISPALAAGAFNWTYDLDEGSSAVQALNLGQTLTDSFTVTISDTDGGTTTQVISVTINGSNDAPPVPDLVIAPGNNAVLITANNLEPGESAVLRYNTPGQVIAPLEEGVAFSLSMVGNPLIANATLVFLERDGIETTLAKAVGVTEVLGSNTLYTALNDGYANWIFGSISALSNTLVGNAQDDIIFGRGGSDTLRGMGGNDTLLGGAGSDSLFGGMGADTIYLGANDGVPDTVYFGAGEQVDMDVIYDFNADNQDKIDLAALLDAVGIPESLRPDTLNISLAPGGVAFLSIAGESDVPFAEIHYTGSFGMDDLILANLPT